MLKKVICRMLGMCDAAWYIFIRTIQLSAVLLLCCFMLLLEYEATGSYELYWHAHLLYEQPQALLLLAMLFSVIIEDIQSRSSQR